GRGHFTAWQTQSRPARARRHAEGSRGVRRSGADLGALRRAAAGRQGQRGRTERQGGARHQQPDRRPRRPDGGGNARQGHRRGFGRTTAGRAPGARLQLRRLEFDAHRSAPRGREARHPARRRRPGRAEGGDRPGAGRGLRAGSGGRPRTREGIRRRHADLRQGRHCEGTALYPRAFELAFPSASASANQAAIAGIAISEIAGSPRPSERRPANNQPPTASAPRNTTTSITFFALYFCSRGSAVKRISRAGFEMAKFAVRWIAWNAITTASAGIHASTAKPKTNTSVSNSMVPPTP